jgi:phospholipid/cholesterol/gamma-HCH transport system ATP-binding protein
VNNQPNGPEPSDPITSGHRSYLSPQKVSVAELLEVDVTAIRAPRRVLLEKVNWSIQTWDYWVVGGLPGSGKTDLLNTVAGLHRPERGELRLFGRSFEAFSEEELVAARRRIGFVFAYEARLFTGLTVAENLALPLQYHWNWTVQEAEDRVAMVLENLELAPLAHTRADRVPRSLRQKVGLARALMLSPDLLLLDNPLAGADPRQRRWWIDFLGALASGNHVLGKPGMTLVVGTDDFRPWKEREAQFALLEENRWIPLGGWDELRRHQAPLLRELLEGGV